ncbi:MAG: hypothetical protein ACOYNK_06435, partial [Microbacteriaceae bacterium]
MKYESRGLHGIPAAGRLAGGTRNRPPHHHCYRAETTRRKVVPTIQQLVRKGRSPKVTKTKAPALK